MLIAEGGKAAIKPPDDGFGLADETSAMRCSKGAMSFQYLCQARRVWNRYFGVGPFSWLSHHFLGDRAVGVADDV